MEIKQRAKDGKDLYYFSSMNYNEILLFAGVSGSGKSTGVMEYCYKKWKSEKPTIIFLTEKPTDVYSNGFCVFQVEAKWHLDLLNNHNIHQETIPSNFYHPITIGNDDNFMFNPSKKNQKINFYSFPITSMTDEDFTILYNKEDVKDNLVLLSRNYSKNLNDNEDLFDLMRLMFENQEKNVSRLMHVDKGFDLPTIPEKVHSKLRFLSKILEPFFHNNMFISSKSNKYNINWKNILEDNENWHFFSDIYLYPEKRLVYFDIFKNLEMIETVLSTEIIKNKVIIVLEELKALLPNKDKQNNYQKLLAKKVIELLTKIRTKATIIITTQSPFNMDREVLNLIAGDKLLFRQGEDDTKRFIKDYGFTISLNDPDSDNSKLKRLDLYSGNFYIWNAKDKIGANTNLSDERYKIFPPPFRLSQGENFFELYKKHYPEKCVDHLEVFKYHKDLLLNSKTRNIAIINEVQKKMIEKEREKEEKKSQPKIGELKEEVKEEKKKSKDEKILRVIELSRQKKANGKPYSFREIGSMVDLSHVTISKILKEKELEELQYQFSQSQKREE